MVWKRYVLPVLIFICVGTLYVHNLSQSVYGGDVGDLISAASLGGVAHPPGYPLFTLIGFLLTRFTLSFLTQAFLVGLISAISGTLGIVAMFYIALTLTKSKLISLLSALALSFSFLYWFYAEIAEVFALNAFFALILFLLALLYRQTKKKGLLLLFFFSLGLSFCNHQTIIFIVPSLLLLIGKNTFLLFKKQRKYIWLSILIFLLGLAPLVYIPIAASFHPVVNWDNVHDLSSFLHLLLRKDYGTFQAGTFAQVSLWQRFVILQVYLSYLLMQMTIPVAVGSIIGFFVLFKKDQLLFYSLLIAFLLSGPLFVVYAGFPLIGSFYMGVYERFFLLSSVILFIPFGIGIQWIATWLSLFLKNKTLKHLFVAVFFLIPLLLFAYNFQKTDLSSVHVGDNLAYDTLSPLPPNSVLVFSGDTIVFNTWYIHYVRKFRPDILIYNIGGGAEGGPFNAVVNQGQKKYNKNESEKIDALLSVLKDLRRTHRIFSTVIMQPTKGDKITWIPYGLTYAYVNADIDMPSHDLYLKKITSIWSELHPITPQELQKKVYHNVTIAEFPTVYSNAALAVGTYLYSQYQDGDNALKFYKKALEFDPTNAKAYLSLGVFYTGQDGHCKDVVSNLSTAISLNPFDKLPYFLLYNAYAKCSSDKSYAADVKTEFNRVFGQDFFTELKKETNL